MLLYLVVYLDLGYFGKLSTYICVYTIREREREREREEPKSQRKLEDEEEEENSTIITKRRKPHYSSSFMTCSSHCGPQMVRKYSVGYC